MKVPAPLWPAALSVQAMSGPRLLFVNVAGGLVMSAIRNPVEWSVDQLKQAAHAAGEVGHSIRGEEEAGVGAAPVVRRIEVADLRDALRKGLDDFLTFRSDVVFIGVVYPLAGLVLAWFIFHADLLPLLFPLGSGFALLGPIAAVGLNELSRRREKGLRATWGDAFGMITSPSFGAILVLGLVLLGIFVLWLGAAQVVYVMTLGPEPPASLGGFVTDLFTTGAGWAMIWLGCGLGFLFALAVLAISVVSFPLLLDRDVGVYVAIMTSVKVFLENPRVISVWGLIVAGGLVIGSVPLFMGLIIVMPVLGHATWHLYRKAVR
jgi:uncharacterized membrane protein